MTFKSLEEKTNTLSGDIRSSGGVTGGVSNSL